MINVCIQFFTLVSGLLVNFLIPILFGLEEYGVFIKANILVFLFHKFTDVVSEPLISNVDRNILLPVALSIGLFISLVFLLVNSFYPAGSLCLLLSMIWSSCILLTMIAQKKLNWVLVYLAIYCFIFIALLGLVFLGLFQLKITNVLEITNFLPSTFCFIILLATQKLELACNNIFSNSLTTLKFIPRLFSLTLVNNLFTNILPFYLSFVFPPALLGLFRVQVSVVQSVSAIFPINTKTISEYLNKSDFGKDLLSHTLTLSLNYFYLISLVGYIFIGLFEKQPEFAQIFIILPVMHAAMVIERYLLGSSKNNRLILINILVAFFSGVGILYVYNISQMLLLYATAISLYLFLLVSCIECLKIKKLVRLLAFTTPGIMYYSTYLATLGSLFLLISFIVIMILMPINKDSLTLVRG